MSGQINLEGQSPPVYHPRLGELGTDALKRRAMSDFPPLAWFTTRIEVPNCLRRTSIFYIDKYTGEQKKQEGDRDMSDVIALNRLALGFPLGNLPFTRWADYPGYSTAEGRDLNESAIEAGDDPLNWYVSEQPIDVLQAVEVWSSRKIINPKLERWDWYLKDVHHMVKGCRESKMYIPPAWLTPAEAKALSNRIGLPAVYGSADASKRIID
jgi:hypothetical protein